MVGGVSISDLISLQLLRSTFEALRPHRAERRPPPHALMVLQDDANEWKMRYDEENGISNSMHDAPAAAPRLTTPVGTADEDHVGSMADLVFLNTPPPLFRHALRANAASAAPVVRSHSHASHVGCVAEAVAFACARQCFYLTARARDLWQRYPDRTDRPDDDATCGVCGSGADAWTNGRGSYARCRDGRDARSCLRVRWARGRTVSRIHE